MQLMGHFTAIGMRVKVTEPDAMVINTCSGNDTAERGTLYSWSWSNPTNRAIVHRCPTDPQYEAVSVEAMWQGTKIFQVDGTPDLTTLSGEWRRGKAKRPIGAWNGHNPLITTPGEARVKIYIPCFKALIEHWLQDPQVAEWVKTTRDHKGNIYLRDHDTGRGIHRNGPMSHAYLLCEYLNTGNWPV